MYKNLSFFSLPHWVFVGIKSTWVKYWSLEEVLGVKREFSCTEMSSHAGFMWFNPIQLMEKLPYNASLWNVGSAFVDMSWCLLCTMWYPQEASDAWFFFFLLSVHLFKLMRIWWDLFPVAALQVGWWMTFQYLFIYFYVMRMLTTTW